MQASVQVVMITSLTNLSCSKTKEDCQGTRFNGGKWQSFTHTEFDLLLTAKFKYLVKKMHMVH